MTSYAGAVPNTLEPAGGWMTRAVCAADPDSMFPDNNQTAIANAKRICGMCPVTEPCLQTALDDEGDAGRTLRHGIRGGLTPSQRRRAHEQGLTAAVVLRRMRLRTAPGAEVLRDLYDRYTTPTGDGHLVWSGTFPSLMVREVRITVQQLAFQVGYGREPVGTVRRSCDRERCVGSAHLMDQQERNARRTAERAEVNA